MSAEDRAVLDAATTSINRPASKAQAHQTSTAAKEAVKHCEDVQGAKAAGTGQGDSGISIERGAGEGQADRATAPQGANMSAAAALRARLRGTVLPADGPHDGRQKIAVNILPQVDAQARILPGGMLCPQSHCVHYVALPCPCAQFERARICCNSRT